MMPTYEYECEKCACRFELKKRFSEGAGSPDCPECGGKVRQIYSPAAIVFKGSGFYVTDYRNKSDYSSEAGKAEKAEGGKIESGKAEKVEAGKKEAGKTDKTEGGKVETGKAKKAEEGKKEAVKADKVESGKKDVSKADTAQSGKKEERK
jgi:putative FmdB family regulatory protein